MIPLEQPVSDRLDAWRKARDGVTVPTIWVAIALSLLIHAAVLWQWWPRLYFPSLERPELGASNGSLVVRLAPPPGPPPAPPSPALPALPVSPSPVIEARPPKAVPRPRPAPQILALAPPAQGVPSPPPAAPSVSAPTPARPTADGDLASYIEARRRARAESAPPVFPGSVASAPPVEDDNARANRIAAANLGTNRTPSFGQDPTKGGVFQIVRIGYESAEFIFFGWNSDIRRNTAQRFEVSKGNSSDIRIAVVRRMIAIIRENAPEDFFWESQRLGRNVSLSARARDSAGLEDFLMREFFGDPRRPQFIE